MGLLRFLGYILFISIAILLVIKSSKGPTCQQCRKRVGKKGIQRHVYGEEQLLCQDCNDRMKANEGIADSNNLV